ncbi:hypothetical protein [Aquimarina agarilytica]|uniref:hypothetical protein n=1 Tax=Aquimarina agarilytica TaxID=1087449 RepID=UPI0002891FA2|nr:hypothetical protein [Aquimarina agarilytica]
MKKAVIKFIGVLTLFLGVSCDSDDNDTKMEPVSAISTNAKITVKDSKFVDAKGDEVEPNLDIVGINLNNESVALDPKKEQNIGAVYTT